MTTAEGKSRKKPTFRKGTANRVELAKTSSLVQGLASFSVSTCYQHSLPDRHPLSMTWHGLSVPSPFIWELHDASDLKNLAESLFLLHHKSNHPTHLS